MFKSTAASSVILCLAFMQAIGSTDDRVTVRPSDTGEALVNPGMGWTLHFYSNFVEDCHASYMSIHWWPREELEENREIIRRINRRLGYRLQLREMSWPVEARLGEPFVVQTSWANAGVAPCYPGGFWALTLKDAKGGIVSVHVDEQFDVRGLEVGPPDRAPAARIESRFTVALPHRDPHSAAQPQPNGDAEGTGGVAWQPLSRAALWVATSSPGAGVLETEAKSFGAKSFKWQEVCAACANSVG